MSTNKYAKEQGITLIALAVTIVVLLILAGVSLNAVFGQNGIISKAQEAQNKMNEARDNDLAVIEYLNKQMDNWLKQESEGPTVTVGGSEVTLTKENVWQYLGKVVSNYKSGAAGTETVTIDENEYTVSTTYRLYYVDFDGKYGEKDTIYLKADCAGSYRYSLPTIDTISTEDSSVKIKDLNPALYANETTSPDTSNDNMKAVIWLLNTTNWEGLKDTNFSSKTNYIVGSPSLEMMMDSYNTHYRLTGETPDTRELDENSSRVKLFYQYPYKESTNNYGYAVGPSNYSSASNGYWYLTSDWTVKSDAGIDSLYFPGGFYYWLSSPSAINSYSIMLVTHDDSRISNNQYSAVYAFCPVVSLQSNVKLELN